VSCGPVRTDVDRNDVAHLDPTGLLDGTVLNLQTSGVSLRCSSVKRNVSLTMLIDSSRLLEYSTRALLCAIYILNPIRNVLEGSLCAQQKFEPVR